jgi:hypothetical protein
MMSKPSKEFLNPKTLLSPPGYSHVVKVNKGTTVYIAGQVACDASGKLVGEGDFEAQAEQVSAISSLRSKPQAAPWPISSRLLPSSSPTSIRPA